MPVPTYDRFIDPILRYLAAHPAGAAARDAHEAAADALHLTEADRAELLPSGVQTVYKNRAGWAHDRLKRAGYSESPKRGYWCLTDAGRAFADSHPTPLSDAQVDEIAKTNIQVKLSGSDSPEESAIQALPDEGASSPDDRLDGALAEIRASVAAELLETILHPPPKFFDPLAPNPPHARAYDTSRSDLTRVGGSGDAGIDGIISLDRLGLEKVYVQAKRWQNAVGRPEVQGFYGALAGQRANKGVFITTSTFSSHAIDFAASVERIVLVDGQRLAELMMDHGVGVSHRLAQIPKIDSDYFEE